VRFEWHDAKGRENRFRHRVSFEEASTAFGDPLSVTIDNPLHSEGEFRYLLIGMTERLRLVVVAHVERGDTVRIISARPASARERKTYEEG
jgi:uncharacterized DUF497 family protein